jgi:hypothetical protein
MRHQLANLAALFLLLLSLTSAAMWARSQWVDEAWESQARSQWDGWSRYYVVASSNGRFGLAMTEAPTPSPGPPVVAGVRYTPGRGYMHPAPALISDTSAYALRDSRFGSRAGWLPGVEWASSPRLGWYDPGRWLFSISWLVFVAVFAILPAARGWRRWRQSRRPAFPVITSDATDGA